MRSSSTSLAIFLSIVAAMISHGVSEKAIKSVYDVKYTVNRNNRIVDVISVNNKPLSVEIVAANGQSSGQKRLDLAHHFPGVIVDGLVFDTGVGFDARTVLQVLLDNGTLLRVVPDRVYTNFHTHNRRMVYGQLRTFALRNFAAADQIYIGAPIFLDGKLVSVVTCRFDDYDNGVVLFPVSAVRAPGLMSGQIHFDDKVIVEKLRPGMSIYGRVQLPYNAQNDSADSSILNLKRFAVSASDNRLMYRNLPRTIVVFHDRKQISIGLVEGEFEIDRVRLDGPLIVPQSVE
ncbi:P26-1 [Euproctis pseudoconspersa nucleopolyhedrovirus]|uniref:p26-1 n=1 Tax=Euproctis pseudoconspersa nucleopolyhedrovirus TaxID=307467 RepID=C3TWV9_9ABAC|nr:P26-1 [Euproctis pseudoconspersa nucleopolyhedrovirus]ACO53501.1 P26-1 [Euproctis pseudoconspersa nucleopolyhedrovirus]